MHLRGKGGFSFPDRGENEQKYGKCQQELVTKNGTDAKKLIETVLFFCVMGSSPSYKRLDVKRYLEVLQVLGAHNQLLTGGVQFACNSNRNMPPLLTKVNHSQREE